MSQLSVLSYTLISALGLIIAFSVYTIFDIQSHVGAETAAFASIPFIVAIPICGFLLIVPIITILTKSTWNQERIRLFLILNLSEMIVLVAGVIWVVIQFN